MLSRHPLLASLACLAILSPPSYLLGQCHFAVPADAVHPRSTGPTSLAGDYQLEQIPWQPAGSERSVGQLHLEPPPPGAPAADLIGWLETAAGGAPWQRIVGSRDPRAPGVILRGTAMRIGQHGGIDGIGNNFTITAVSPLGFWGYWVEDLGMAMAVDTVSRAWLPDGAGYFCAVRLTKRP